MVKKHKVVRKGQHVAHRRSDEANEAALAHDEDELEHEEGAEMAQDNPTEAALRSLVELLEHMGQRDHPSVIAARMALPQEEVADKDD